MKKLLLLALPLLITACDAASNTVDKDGVPIVDLHGRIQDPPPEANKGWVKPNATRMISVNGKEMPLREFIQTYCTGKIGNATCSRATTISRIDSSKGPQKELPKGI